MPPAIQINSLSKTFTKGRCVTKALDGIDLRIDRGEMVALIGASGSGKSTLIRNVIGLTASDCDSAQGQITVLGNVVQRAGKIAKSVRETRSRVGVVFQQFNLVGRLSLLTNVTLGFLGRIPGWRGTLGLFSRDERMAAMEALQRVGIDRYATQRASTLSGGQQQRAAIARALVQQAEIIIADEPVASLDPESARRVMDNLARINREDGITVLVSLHQVDFATRFCPRTVALRDGKVVFDGPSRELTPEFLRDLYGAASEELILQGPLGEAAKTAPPVPVLENAVAATA